MKAQMARIIEEYMQAIEKAQYAYSAAVTGNSDNPVNWIHAVKCAARVHQEAVSAAGREAIEKSKKLLGVNDA